MEWLGRTFASCRSFTQAGDTHLESLPITLRPPQRSKSRTIERKNQPMSRAVRLVNTIPIANRKQRTAGTATNAPGSPPKLAVRANRPQAARRRGIATAAFAIWTPIDSRACEMGAGTCGRSVGAHAEAGPNTAPHLPHEDSHSAAVSNVEQLGQ